MTEQKTAMELAEAMVGGQEKFCASVAEIRERRKANMQKAREARAANIAARREAEGSAVVPAEFPKDEAVPVFYHIPHYICSKCGREAIDAQLSPGKDAKIQCVGCTNSAVIKRPVVKF